MLSTWEAVGGLARGGGDEMLRNVGFGSNQTSVLLLALSLSNHVALAKSLSEFSFLISEVRLRHRAWQNPHQQ